MATITSTIKLVDQMSPTLNKISKAIDRVNSQANKMGSIKTWGGFNAGARTATKSTHNLYNAIRRTVFVLGTLRGLQGLSTVADTMMNATARINNLTGDLAKTKYYLDAIYASAQRSRGSFTEMANSVGKLGTIAGDAFGSVEEMIAFTELMNKLFVLSGASAAESSNAMYQLTQAMAAGKLQGDEMRSILENAPMLAQKIADKLGVTKGEIKQLGADGKITADIIKEALFDAADDIEEKFEHMPKTIGQTWTEIKNHAINSFRPVITAVQNFINSPIFEKFKNRLFGIINAIANGVIRLFNLFQTPVIQNAVSKICAALGVLWDIVLDIGNLMVNVAVWICDNWSWIGQIVYSVIAVVLLYKAVMLAVSAAVCIANIAQGISAWVAALMAGQAWAWVILVIIALVAIIYIGVAAWNYFTDSAVSATGFLFGAIALVISGIIWLFQLLWDGFGVIVDGLVMVARMIWQIVVDIVQFIAKLLVNIITFVVLLIISVIAVVVSVGIAIYKTVSWIVQVLITFGLNFVKFIGNLLSACLSFIGAVLENIGASFLWIGAVFKTWGSNISIGMSQLCDQLPLYWEAAGYLIKASLWGIAIGAGEAFNSMLLGASDCAKKMLQPFENFANGVIDLLNGLIGKWNQFVGSLSITIPGLSIMGEKVWGEKTLKLSQGVFGLTELKHVSINDWSDPKGISLDSAQTNQGFAQAAALSALGKIKPINWSTNELPKYSEYVNWGSTIDAFNKGMDRFDYKELPEYIADWTSIWGTLKDLWSSVSWLNLGGAFNGSDYSKIWGDFKSDVSESWNPETNVNPWEIAKDWYNKGATLEEGLNGIIEGIGGLLSGLFGGGNTGEFTGSWADGVISGSSGSSGSEIPSSLEDLLGGYSPSGGGSGIGDKLGAIADNTGSSAGSASNIEDTLDLAEEELELLRKLAEQEVINRFTTAEIHVDMTNNNNVSSNMDLDGIVTHLSNKLYEELGVVASGVHY